MATIMMPEFKVRLFKTMARRMVTGDDGRQVPTGLVDVFARNLFLDVNGPTETQHPIEQLLTKAGKIEISKGRVMIDNAPPR